MTNEEFVRKCKTCTPEQLCQMLKNGANVNARDNDGNTALMVAARQNPSLEVTAILLQAGADITVRNTKGKTAINQAAYNPDPRVAKFLASVSRNGLREEAALSELLEDVLMDSAVDAVSDCDFDFDF
ncbi:MAG: ankyrin repeat domain-containing protein [Deltaproteobacteria bacterium]|nr:ankyrin repeat domain-containing protein [Deltaproteobacteria bacterium]